MGDSWKITLLLFVLSGSSEGQGQCGGTVTESIVVQNPKE